MESDLIRGHKNRMTGGSITIGVIDGQGGGIGSNIIKRLQETIGQEVELEIIALGTNAMATSNMMKAKANRGASGENAILYCLPMLDVIVGALSIVIPNSMLGEVTPKIAEAVASAKGHKILLPLKVPNLELAGYTSQPFPHLIDDMLRRLQEWLNSR